MNHKNSNNNLVCNLGRTFSFCISNHFFFYYHSILRYINIVSLSYCRRRKRKAYSYFKLDDLFTYLYDVRFLLRIVGLLVLFMFGLETY